MKSEARISNMTTAEMQEFVASLPVKQWPIGDVTRRTSSCVYAKDTGRLAFACFPCRGNLVLCEKTGNMSFRAACRPERCNLYSGCEETSVTDNITETNE